ncbi:MAG: sensor histidine kinase [Solirubrobacterales bacterium]
MRWRARFAVSHGLRSRLFDVMLALAFVTIAQMSVWTSWSDEQGRFDGPVAVNALLALVFTAPLAWRRRAPLAALTTMMAGLLVQVLLVEPAAPFFGGYIPVLIASYSVAAYAPLRRALIGGAVAVIGVLVVTLSVEQLSSPSDVAFDVIVVAVIWLVGRGMHVRAAHAAALSDHVRALERTREQEAHEAVMRERARIARELHDVIAHSVSVMGVQAAAAEQVLTLDPERAREPLRAIQNGAREAIAELRLLLGVLRNGDDAPTLAPQPGLAQLGPLVEQMRQSGLPARLTVEGDPQRLSAGIELSAYRIVQEALTNVLKHAGAADASVTIRHGWTALELEVVDTGSGGRDGTRAGHGLIGMRERVALHGGTITTGPEAAGGYTVRARLPLDRHQ